MHRRTTPPRTLPMALATWSVVSLALLQPGCSQRYEPGESRPRAGFAPGQISDVQRTIDAFVADEPRLREYFDEAHGYAIFPTVGKGGFVVGGAHGKGRVFEQGVLVGNARITQVTVGFQWGGQAYSQVIFFRDETALERFKKGRSEFGARASAVAADAGMSADSAWSDGVAVFTRTKGGLMAEASVGAQDFDYIPLE